VTGLEPTGEAALAWCESDAGAVADCRRTASRRASAAGSATFRVDPSPGDWLLVLDGSGTPVAATFVAHPSRAPAVVDHDARRLVLGLGVAALLLALATWLVRSTDWRPAAELSVDEAA
jgi:hypothetical protein